MKKIMLAVVAMAALVFASCSNGMVANDSLSSPDVVATATDNGVIVLTWENVMDATSYAVSVKYPGTEEYQKSNITVSAQYGRNIAVFTKADKLDTKYEFKVFANSSKGNVLGSVAEVSVTTPEEWKALTINAADVKLEKVPGTANKFNAIIPVDAGYTYEVKTTTANVEAAVAFAKAAALQANINGADFVKEVGTNADGDEIVINPTMTQQATFNTKDAQYLVVKATPVNANVGKVVYAISAASVAADLSKGVKQPTTPVVTRTSATSARITTTVAQINNADCPAENLVLYRQATTNVAYGSNLVEELGAWTKVGTMKKAVQVGTVDTAIYYFDDTITAYEENKAGAVTAYNYFVANAGNEINDYVCSVEAGLNNKTTSTDAAYNYPTNGTNAISTFTVNQKTTNGTTLEINTTIYKDAKIKAVTYGKFATLNAAKKATAADLTSTITLDGYGTESNAVFYSIVDGVKNYTYYGAKSLKNTVEADIGVTNTTDSEGVTTTKDDGAYYVFRIEVEYAGNTFVRYAGAYLTKTTVGTATPTITKTDITF